MVKCSECPHQKFPKLDHYAAESHLKGFQTIGSYAIRKDDTCNFLACDFDGSTWKEDVLAYKQTARELGLDIAVEKSRYRNGAHAWLSFDEFVPARLARSLGTLILAKCSEVNPRLSSRDTGNSSFLSENLSLIDDQWKFLSEVRVISRSELQLQ